MERTILKTYESENDISAKEMRKEQFWKGKTEKDKSNNGCLKRDNSEKGQLKNKNIK